MPGGFICTLYYEAKGSNPKLIISAPSSVTRLGDILDFGQILEQQLICPNLPHSLAIFVKVSKSFIFQVKPFLGNFYRDLAIFIWSHWLLQNLLDSTINCRRIVKVTKMKNDEAFVGQKLQKNNFL